jgi:hypothetical protein
MGPILICLKKNLNVNSLKGDLSNPSTFNSPHFGTGCFSNSCRSYTACECEKSVNKASKSLDYFFTDFLDFIMYFSTLSVPESEKVDLLHDQRFPAVRPPGHKEHHSERPLNVTHKKQGRKVQDEIVQSSRKLP